VSLHFFLRRLAAISGKSQSSFHFIRLMRVHPVVKPAPLRVATIQFFVCQFACFRATPRFGGESFEHGRPAALGIFVAVGMKAGKEIRKR
jgi:hypothetical protein